MQKRVVIFMGPVGAGKGTQADIIAEQKGHLHLESSKVIEGQFNSNPLDEEFLIDGKTYTYGEEKHLWATGKLCTPEVVSYWMKQEIRHHAREGTSLVFSGSPRTLFEAKEQVPLHKELYGIENIHVVLLGVPAETSIYRNSNRRICSSCRHPVPFSEETKNLTTCPKCGEPLMHRELDKPDVIKVRLVEYKERTLPIVEFLRESGLRVAEIDGEGDIDEVAKRVKEVLRD